MPIFPRKKDINRQRWSDAVKLTVALALAVIATVGCQSPLIKDPNDPAQAGMMQPGVLLRDLQTASDAVNQHVINRDITIAQGQKILSDYANHLLSKVKVEETPQDQAWKYAEVLITAKQWSRARDMLKAALVHSPNEDRWVNDTLRLARCDAELGDVDQAIALTKSTFRVTPEWKWPILYATYLEIVPAALKHSKHRELELAKLVESAIHQHELAWGDPNQDKYKEWLAYRKYQIEAAWAYIASIYRQAGEPELARQALSNASHRAPTYGV